MAEQKRDYYEVLGIDKNADDAAIKKAYRALAKKYHPDMNPGDAEAEKKFKEASEAYAILSDPEKKRQYEIKNSRLLYFFDTDIQDIITGYRAFNYPFVKTFPVLSRGFEIETEMSIHAADKNMQVGNVVIEYMDRPEGSVSKLNTFSDGFRVLKTIARIYQTYKPMNFFGIIAAVLALLSIGFMIPILIQYGQTGLVPHFPTLIACGFVMLAAIQSFFSGLILTTLGQKNRQDFEMQLQTMRIQRDKL